MHHLETAQNVCVSIKGSEAPTDTISLAAFVMKVRARHAIT